MLNETQGSIDNQLKFMQLCNAAWVATSLASNGTTLSIQVAMQTINDLAALLPTEPTSLNPNALAVWTILNAPFTNQYIPIPGTATTLATLCGYFSTDNTNALLSDTVTYFSETNCWDFTTVTNFTTYSGSDLVTLLATIPSAYKDWCNLAIAIAIGWPSLSVTSGSKAPDLFNTVNDYYINNGTGKIGTPQTICAAITQYKALAASASDGYLKVLYYYITTAIDLTDGYRCFDCGSDGSAGLTNALANSTSNFEGQNLAANFLQILSKCINAEYTNAGISASNPTGPVGQQCSGNPNGGPLNWYQATSNPLADTSVPCKNPPKGIACPGVSGWHPFIVIPYDN